MADLLGTLTNGLSDGGGYAAGPDGAPVGSGPGILAGETGSNGDTSNSSSSFDLSKVLNVDNNTTYEQTTFSDDQSSSQDSSIVDNGSESSQSSETTSDGGNSSSFFESSDADFGGSQSDSSESSSNVDFSSTSFTNEFSLDSSLDLLSHTANQDGGGLLGLG